VKELDRMQSHRPAKRRGLIDSILKVAWLDTKERLLHNPNDCRPITNNTLKLGEKVNGPTDHNKSWARYISRVHVFKRAEIHMPSSQDSFQEREQRRLKVHRIQRNIEKN
jgi:hypothetical protein